MTMYVSHAHTLTPTHEGLIKQSLKMFLFFKLCLQGSGRVHSLTRLTRNSNPWEKLLYRDAHCTLQLKQTHAHVSHSLFPFCPWLHNRAAAFHPARVKMTNSHSYLLSTCWQSTACYSAHKNYRFTFSPATPSEHGVTWEPWIPQALEGRTAAWLGNSRSSSTGRKRHAWNTGKTHASRQSRGF